MLYPSQFGYLMTWAEETLKDIDSQMRVEKQAKEMFMSEMSDDRPMRAVKDRVTVAQALDELHVRIADVREKTEGLARKMDPILSVSPDATKVMPESPTDPMSSQVLASIIGAINEICSIGYYVDDLYERTNL